MSPDRSMIIIRFKDCSRFLNPAGMEMLHGSDQAYGPAPFLETGKGAVRSWTARKMKEGKELIRYFCSLAK